MSPLQILFEKISPKLQWWHFFHRSENWRRNSKSTALGNSTTTQPEGDVKLRLVISVVATSFSIPNHLHIHYQSSWLKLDRKLAETKWIIIRKVCWLFTPETEGLTVNDRLWSCSDRPSLSANNSWVLPFLARRQKCFSPLYSKNNCFILHSSVSIPITGEF